MQKRKLGRAGWRSRSFGSIVFGWTEDEPMARRPGVCAGQSFCTVAVTGAEHPNF
jgi:hypothetical protein